MWDIMNFATLKKHIKKTLFETRSDEKKKTFASVSRTTKSMVTWTPDSKMLKITIEKMHNIIVGWFFDFKESPTQPRNLLLPLSPLPGFLIQLPILPFFRIRCSVAIFLISKPLYSSFSQFNSILDTILNIDLKFHTMPCFESGGTLICFKWVLEVIKTLLGESYLSLTFVNKGEE